MRDPPQLAWRRVRTVSAAKTSSLGNIHMIQVFDSEYREALLSLHVERNQAGAAFRVDLKHAVSSKLCRLSNTVVTL